MTGSPESSLPHRGVAADPDGAANPDGAADPDGVADPDRVAVDVSAAAARLAAWDAAALTAALDADGFAVLTGLLDPPEADALAACWDGAAHRAEIDMARHGFGRGRYRYFAAPLPAGVAALRRAAWRPLAPVANAWAARLEEKATGGAALDGPALDGAMSEAATQDGAARNAPDPDGAPPYPEDFDAWIARCHAAGQTRPTPLILDYGPGDYNRLHQDVYGALVFPLQIAVLLAQPGVDFTGGEFIVAEGRPRQQTRASVVPLARGDAVAFPVRARPVQGARGWYRAAMRHGVSTVRTGRRRTLGLILHDAR